MFTVQWSVILFNKTNMYKCCMRNTAVPLLTGMTIIIIVVIISSSK